MDKGKKLLSSPLFKHVCVTLLAFSLMLFFGFIALNVKFFDSISKAVSEVSTDDIYYSILRNSEPEVSNNIVMVDITQVYNRAEMAQLIEDVETFGAKTVGIDCCFEFEDAGTPTANDSLIAVADKYKNIVFSLKLAEMDFEEIYHKETHSFMYFYVDTMTEGFTNVKRTLYGGLKRVTPMAGMSDTGPKRSFAAQVAGLYANKDFAAEHPEELHINFTPTVFPSFQPKDVRKYKDAFKDKIVLFAALSQEEDFHWTPIGKIAGTELLAYSIQTVLDKKETRKASLWFLILISFGIALVAQILQQMYLDKMATYKNPFVRYIIGSAYVLNIITYLFIAIIIWISFIVFQKFNYSIDFVYGIGATAFLTTSRYMYVAIKDYYFHKDDKQ